MILTMIQVAEFLKLNQSDAPCTFLYLLGHIIRAKHRAKAVGST